MTATAAGRRTRPAPIVAPGDGWSVAIVAGYAAVALLVALGAGAPRLLAPVLYLPSYLFYAGLAVYSAAVLLVWCRWSARGPDGRWVAGRAGWRAGWVRFRTRHLAGSRATSATLMAVLVPLFMNLFGSLKAAMPVLRPFAWDQRLRDADRLLHAGRDPWRWLDPVFGSPAATRLLDLAYYAWLPVTTTVVIWFAWSGRRGLRARFFAAWLLAWALLGTALAYAFSSAGPVYYGFVTGDHAAFAPLLTGLADIGRVTPLTALEVHRLLWHDYLHRSANPFTGIAAMPSLHVALPVLYALAFRPVHRRVSVGFWVYAAVILVGSVRLGWHYAVDGYVAVLGILAIWAVTARLDREPATQECAA